MVEFTFVELHLEDVQFPSGPFSGSDGRETTRSTAQETDRDEDGGASIAPTVGAVVLVAAIALAARRLLRGGDADLAEPESTDPLAAD